MAGLTKRQKKELAQQKELEDKRKAYEDALSTLDPQAPARSFVQMKLDDIGGSAAPVAADKAGS